MARSRQRSWPPGQTVTATISKLVAFGAFARVAEGVEGLIHISELANERIAHPKQVVQVGDTVLVRILNIEPTRRRLSLSLRQAVHPEEGDLTQYSSPAVDDGSPAEAEQEPPDDLAAEPEAEPSVTPRQRAACRSESASRAACP